MDMLFHCPAFERFEPLFFDPNRHRQSLALLASASLTAERADLAFAFADRRCRLSAPTGRDYLLRAIAARVAGREDEARADLDRAFDIDPADEMILSCALSWGRAPLKAAAAATLIESERENKDSLRKALAILRAEGVRFAARLRERHRAWSGWIAWDASCQLEIDLPREPTRAVQSDGEHPLAGGGWQAADVVMETGGAAFALRLDGEIVRHVGGGRQHGHMIAPAVGRAQGVEADRLNVIVTVYENFEATVACFEALFADGSTVPKRVIAVDDASPNEAIRSWLSRQAARGTLETIRNEVNLGFAASVNRALTFCDQGDVLLLNADAFLTPRAIDRLAAVARSAEDIGTVTPFSNNGEFSSFPEPNVLNPLPDLQTRREIAEAAFTANGNAAVDMPNGVGFCLYVTRACLDRVGALPELYARGYYEDVEFGLRAREAGLRNVCATGVYVAHAGAQSFRGDKRALVLRNLAILESRFPDHRRECAAFLAADPLDRARAAIEARLPPPERSILMIAPEGEALRLAQERGRDLARADPRGAVLVCAASREGDRVQLTGLDHATPRSLSFPLMEHVGLAALRDYLRRLRPQVIELFAPLQLPAALLESINDLSARRRMIVGDLRWFASQPPLEKTCPCDDAGTCSACTASPRKAAGGGEKRVRRVAELVRSCDELTVLDAMASAFAARHLTGLPIVSRAPQLPSPRRAATALGRRSVLGVLVPHPTGEADRLIAALARRLRREGAGSLIVLGRCLDDLASMAVGNVFIAGTIDEKESPTVLSLYGVGKLFSPYRTQGFGRLDALSRLAGAPKAYFDWSFGALTRETNDLALDPRVCNESAARAVARWLLDEALPEEAT